jgi:hypothetical protein
MAIPVLDSIHPPMPCSALKTISCHSDCENVHSIDVSVRRATPHKNIRFLPYISAALPKGTRNAAAASKYAVDIQLKAAAFIPNSFPIEGSATVTDELINDGSKADTMIEINTACLIALFFTIEFDCAKINTSYL